MRVLWRGKKKSPQSIARSGTLKHCDFKCVCVRQSESGVRQCQGAILRQDCSFWLVHVNKKTQKKESTNLLKLASSSYFLSYPQIFSRYQSDRSDHNVICQFHCVVNWLFHLATGLWLNFKVILINTILRKQWLYNVSDTAAMTGRDTIPPLPFLHNPVWIKHVGVDGASWLCHIRYVTHAHVCKEEEYIYSGILHQSSVTTL